MEIAILLLVGLGLGSLALLAAVDSLLLFVLSFVVLGLIFGLINREHYGTDVHLSWVLAVCAGALSGALCINFLAFLAGG